MVSRDDLSWGTPILRMKIDGVDNTSEPYILFIDADDTLGDSYSIYSLLEPVKQNGLIDLVYGEGIEELYSIGYPDNARLYKPLHHIDWLMPVLHGKIYKRSYLERIDLKFNYETTHEDICYNIIAYALTDNVQKVKHICFNHHWNGNSVTRGAEFGYFESPLSDKANDTLIRSYLKLVKHIKRFTDNFNIFACDLIFGEFEALYHKYGYYAKFADEDRINKFLDQCVVYYNEVLPVVFESSCADKFIKKLKNLPYHIAIMIL